MLATLFKGIDHIETHTQTMHTQSNIPVTVSGNSTFPDSPLTLKLESGTVRQSQDSDSNVFLCQRAERKRGRWCTCVFVLRRKSKLARLV